MEYNVSVDLDQKIIDICKTIMLLDISEIQKEIIKGILIGILVKTLGEMENMLCSIDKQLRK